MNGFQAAEDIALPLVEEFEGFRANPYPDPATGGEPWTIGYGSTRDANDMPVTALTAPITKQQACDLAMRDMYAAFSSVAASVTAPLTIHETAAIMDFIYNVGAGNFKNSTLLKLINLRQYEAAAKEFEKWDMAAGKVMAGLLRRRVAEEAMFNAPDTASPAAPAPPQPGFVDGIENLIHDFKL